MTGDALVAASALLVGVLLKSLLDLLGWFGQSRIERRRLLSVARREAYADLLLAIGRHNRATDRVSSRIVKNVVGLSDAERLRESETTNALKIAQERAFDDVQRALLMARLVSSTTVASQLDQAIDLLSDGTSTLPLSGVFEPLRRALTA